MTPATTIIHASVFYLVGATAWIAKLWSAGTVIGNRLHAILYNEISLYPFAKYRPDMEWVIESDRLK